MKEEKKSQTELVLTKKDKIKSFKERVLHVKEEEFKNSINLDNDNNMKVKEKTEKSKSHKHKHKHKHKNKTERGKKQKLIINTKNILHLSTENSKIPEQHKNSSEQTIKEKSPKQINTVLIKGNIKERTVRL